MFEDEEYDIVVSFANKFLSQQVNVDSEFSDLIDEYFWELI